MSVFFPNEGDPKWFLLAKVAMGIALIIGAPFLVMPTIKKFNQARQSSSWPQTEAKITKSEVVRESRRGKPSWNPKISYHFTVEGREYTSSQVSWRGFATPIPAHAEEVAEKYPVGSVHKVFYSPDDPSQCVLESGTNWLVTLALFVPLFFVVFGGMLVYENFTYFRAQLNTRPKKSKKVKKKSRSPDPSKRRRRRRPIE